MNEQETSSVALEIAPPSDYYNEDGIVITSETAKFGNSPAVSLMNVVQATAATTSRPTGVVIVGALLAGGGIVLSDGGMLLIGIVVVVVGIVIGVLNKPAHVVQLRIKGAFVNQPNTEVTRDVFKSDDPAKVARIVSAMSQAIASIEPARKAAEEENKQAEAAFDAAHPDTIRCPRCRSTQVTANQKGFGVGKAAAGAILLGPVGLLAGGIGSKQVKITCLKCGHQWEPGKA